MAKTKRNTLEHRLRTLLRGWPLLITIGLVVASFTWYAASAAIILALVPVWYLLHRGALKSVRPGLVVLALTLTGFVSYLGTFGWMVQTDPAQWSNTNGSAVQAAHLFAWVSFAAAHALVWLLFALAAVRFRGPKLLSPWALAALPSAWALGEFIRALATSLIFWGPEGSIGPYWNLGAFGFALSGTPMVFAGRLLGLVGLSFLAVAISLCLYWLMTSGRRLAVAGLGAAAGLALVGYVAYERPDGDTTRVGIVHIDDQTSLSPQTVIPYISAHPQPIDADVLVLPEYSGLYTEATVQSGVQPQLESYAFGGDAGLVIAAGYGTRDDARIGQIGYYAEGRPIAQQEKTFLMPGGEYLPVIIADIVRSSGSPVLLPRFDEARRVNPGRDPEQPVSYAGRTYGTLSCSGVLTPQFYARLAREDAEILVNPTSLIIFRESKQFTEQNKQMVRYQAVANARPFAQSARGARSYVLDHNGRFVLTSQEPLAIGGATVTTNRAKTVSTLLGQWPILLLSAGALGAWFWRTRRRR